MNSASGPRKAANSLLFGRQVGATFPSGQRHRLGRIQVPSPHPPTHTAEKNTHLLCSCTSILSARPSVARKYPGKEFYGLRFTLPLVPLAVSS